MNQVEIWCLAVEDGQALLLLDSLRLVNDRAEPMRGVVLRIDGRGRPQMTAAAQQYAIEMPSAFDVLPALASALEKGDLWTTTVDLFGCRRNCRGRDDDEQPGVVKVDFEIAFPAGDGEALGHSQHGTYWFDPAAGCCTRFESTEIDNLAGRRTETAGVLRARTRKPDGWAERRAAEAEQYLLALRRESSLLAQIQDHPETVEQALSSLDRLWAGQAAAFTPQTDSQFPILARANRQRLAAEGDRLRRIAKYAQSWLGRTAVPWTLPDQRGRMVPSEAVRSGACLEFLWRSGADCAAMLAQLQAARDESPAPEIPIICLNLDQDSTIARRAIAQLPPGLTHVLAGPTEAVERPVELPVMRVLDRDGRIVRVWVGWQPACADAFAEVRRR